jgi:tetratricopeptide (TPR) repeat protein
MTERSHAGLPPVAPRVQAALILACCALAYVTLPWAGWVWDDDSYVTMNAMLRDPGGPWRVWVPGETPQYYPVLFTVFWFEFRLFGTEPLGWHLLNWAAHAGASLLLWRVLLRMRVPGAWPVALMWAVHPMGCESVAWVTEGKNTFSMLAMCASALVWFRGRDQAMERGIGVRAWAASLALFLVAMGCKTTSVALPVMLLAGEWWRGWRPAQDRRVVAAIAPFFVLGVPMGLFTAWVESTYVGAFGPEFAHGAMPRIVIAARALLFYPWVALWPVDLSFIYPRWPTAPLDAAGMAAVAVVVTIAAAASARARHGAPGLLLCALCYGAAIFPALGFINVWPHRYSFVADHFAYVALVPLLVLAVAAVRAAVARLSLDARLGHAMLAAVVTGFVALTAVRTLDYRDEESLWRATIATNPAGWMPRDNLAALLLAQAREAAVAGDADALAALAAEALEHDAIAAEDPSADFTVYSNMSESLRLLGRLEDSLAAIDMALVRAPAVADLHWQRGRLLELSGQFMPAASAYGDAARAPNATVDMALDRIRALVRAGRTDDAARELDAVESRAGESAPQLAPAVRGLRELIERERARASGLAPSPMPPAQPSPPTAVPSTPSP